MRNELSTQLLFELSRPGARACRFPENDVTDTIAAATGFRAFFKQHPDAAKELINVGDSTPDPALDVGELAAWTMVANTLMNRDDFINKA